MKTGNGRRTVLPVWAILLDVVGTLLLAAGIFGMVATEDTLAGIPLGLKEMGVALIILGALLMLPLLIVVVQRLVSGR